MLLAFAAIVVAFAVVNRLAMDGRADVERSLWGVVAWVLLAARAGFVIRYHRFYREEPLRVFDIRDGGFMSAAGMAAVVGTAVWYAWRRSPQRVPLLSALVVGCLVWGAGSAALSLHPMRQKLPPVSLPTLDGETVRISSIQGKPVVVNLWASWCPPCRREMPALAKAQAEHPEVVFVFANQGERPEVVKAYLVRHGLSLRNVVLDGTTAIARQSGSRGLPTTLFFDATGSLVDRRAGELSAATLAQRLERMGHAAPMAGK